MQQETGDYPAAAASHQQALALFSDFGPARSAAPRGRPPCQIGVLGLELHDPAVPLRQQGQQLRT
jgi:hypothetical protein